MTASRVLRLGMRRAGLEAARSAVIGEQIGRITDAEVQYVTLGGSASGSATGAESMKMLRDALVAEECDVLVHAMPDVPLDPYPGLVLGAVAHRLDARDVLVSRENCSFEELPMGARVGADSALRQAQLSAQRPDLVGVDADVDVQANLDRVASGQLDAAVLSAESLGGLGLLENADSKFFDLSKWPTEPGQGALVVEVRQADSRGDSLLKAVLARLNHRPTRAAVTAERVVLARLRESSDAPVGVDAFIDSGLLLLSATVYQPDGSAQLTSAHGVALDGMSPAESRVAVQALGRTVANELLRLGAAELAPLGSNT